MRFFILVLFVSVFIFTSWEQTAPNYDSLFQAFVAKNTIDEGIRYFEQANAKQPNTETILRSLGALHMQKRNFESSKNYYTQALAINPSCGKCFMYLAQASINTDKDFKKANEIIENGLKVDPKEVGLYILRGKLKLANGNESGALNDLYKAIQTDTAQVIGYLERADYYMAKKQYFLAIKDLQIVDRKEPTKVYIKNELAKAYAQDNQFDKALSTIRKAIALDPTNVDAIMISGEVKQMMNDFEGATIDFEKVLDLDKENAYAVYRLSECYYRTEEMDKFCSCINRSIGLSRKGSLPQDDLLDFMVGQRSIVCDSTKSSYYYNRGIAAFNKGKLDESLLWHNKAIQRFPQQRLLHHFKGNTELAQLNFKAAISDFNYAMRDEQAIGSDLKLDGKYVAISDDSLRYLVDGFKMSNMISLVYAHYNLNQLDSAAFYLILLHTYRKSMPELFDLRLFYLEAQVNSDLGNLTDAAIAIEELVKAKVENPIVYNSKAWIKVQTAVGQSFQHDKLVIQDVMDVAEVVYRLPKKMKVKSGSDFTIFKATVEASLASDPNNGEALFLKGLMMWLEKEDPTTVWMKAKATSYNVHFEPYDKISIQ